MGMATVIPLSIMLTVAAAWDLFRHRIPNFLSLGGAGMALLIAATTGGVLGMLLAVAGFAIGLVVFLPMYLKGGMAAGDVKLMAAAGAFLGPAEAMDAVALTLLAGGLFGVGVLVYRGNLAAALGRYLFGIRHFVVGGVWLYLRPAAGEAAAMRFPYALAVATGTGTALLLPPIFGSIGVSA